MNSNAIEALVTNGVALVLLGVVLAAWARGDPPVRQRVILAAVGLAGGLTLLLMLVPLQNGWITVLQEGRSIRNIRQLYGLTTHAGRGFQRLTAALADGGVTTLSAVVRMNLCLAVANTIIFFIIASYVLRSWWASLAFALGYACNLNTLHAAFSETPAMLWTLYFWLGCIAAAVIDNREHATPRLRSLALLLLAVLAVLAALVRSELLIVGAPAVALGAAQVFGGEQRIRDTAEAVGRVVRAVVSGPLFIFLLCVAGLFAIQCLPWLGTISYVIDAVAPLNFSFLLLPQKLGIFLPFGFIALFILGLIHTTRRWLSFLLLPITLLMLFKAYTAAAQGNFENFRYLTFITPVAFFLALFGFRELSDWAEHWAWPPWWKRTAVVLIALSMTSGQPLGPRELFSRRHQLAGMANATPLLGLNQQTEVRYLLDLVARYPTCVFLAKGPQAEASFDPRTSYRWVAFGARVPYVREMPDDGGSVEQVAKQLVPGASCVLFYRSLDCSLVDFDGCRAELHERVAIEERVLENLPYSDISEYGGHRPEIHLGVYPVGLHSDPTHPGAE